MVPSIASAKEGYGHQRSFRTENSLQSLNPPIGLAFG